MRSLPPSQAESGSFPDRAPEPTRFTNGEAYENYMGRWSQGVGAPFLDWLAAPQARRWLDVGCGNGAFTRLIAERAQPASIHGIDPSAAQISFARARTDVGGAVFTEGDAMRLPYADSTFDVAVMPLVLFFLTDPALGVAEMARVVAPGGIVAAYGWDMPEGFPYAALLAETAATGLPTASLPHPEASQTPVMVDLWTRAGLVDIDTRRFTVTRTFAGFEDYWRTVLDAPSAGPQLRALPAAERDAFRERLRARLPVPDGQGVLTGTARANAIRARVPGSG